MFGGGVGVGGVDLHVLCGETEWLLDLLDIGKFGNHEVMAQENVDFCSLSWCTRCVYVPSRPMAIPSPFSSYIFILWIFAYFEWREKYGRDRWVGRE